MTREEAIKRLKEIDIRDALQEDYDALHMAIKALEKEPKVGHWVVHPKGIYAHLVCDKCLSGAPYDCETNYCPNCGAKMKSL